MSISSEKGFMSIVYGVIVVAIIAVFVIQFRPNSGQKTGSLNRQCVVTVRDRCLDAKDFYAAYGLIVPHGIDEQRIKSMGLRREIADGLVERTLLVQDAARLGVTVSDQEINDELVKGRAHVSLPMLHGPMLVYSLGLSPEMTRSLPVKSAETKKFDYKTYQRNVRAATNRSPTEFKEMQRDEITAARMRELIKSRARVSESEVLDAYVREHSTATVDFVRIRRPFIAAHYLSTSPAAVDSWMKSHSDDIEKSWSSRKAEYPPGCRTASHILVRVKSDAQPVGADRDQAQAIIEKALARIRSGESFESVAEEISEDKHSAEHGGQLGCFAKGRMVKPFEEAVFSLKTPGQLSDLVETQYGFHIIRLDGIVGEEPKAAEEQGKALVAREMMIAMQSEDVMAETSKKLRNRVSSGTPLQQALDELFVWLDERYASKDNGAKHGKDKKDAKGKGQATALTDPSRPKVETSEPFSQDGSPVAGAAQGQHAAALAFKLEKAGDVPGDLVRLEDGYAVIVLKDKKAAPKEDFEKMRSDIEARLLNLKQVDLLSDYVYRLRFQARTEIQVLESWTKEPEKTNDND